jgi:hypothetical protein
VDSGSALRKDSDWYAIDDPHLFASRLSDLRIERDQSSGAQIVRWTQPPV